MKWLKNLIRKHKKLEKIILSSIGLSRKYYIYVLNKIYGIDEKKVVFISFGGKSYSDNPRAISERLYEMRPDFIIVWLFNNPEAKRKLVPDYVKCVKANTYSAIKELATAKFWVDNFGKSVYTYKSEDQVYIQTWHGDRGFKKILYDSNFSFENTKYIESEICDLALSASDYGDSVYKTAFHYSGEILKTGSPRNDILIKKDDTHSQHIKEHLKLEKETKILLYAPTLRREASKSKTLQAISGLDLVSVIRMLEEKTESEWICLVRAHSAVKGLTGIPENNIKIRDVTSYEDMVDLLLISDFLITDYSSSAGDFALLNRPIILFQPDRADYIKYDRTFYFNLDESPYIIAQNQEELISKIRNMDYDTIPKNCKDILDFYGTVETGKASEAVVKYMLDKISFEKR